MTNAPTLAEELHRRCGGKNGICSRGLQHQPCQGPEAVLVAIYPDQLCRAILRGIVNQLHEDKLLVKGGFGPNINGHRFEEIHNVDLPDMDLHQGNSRMISLARSLWTDWSSKREPLS